MEIKNSRSESESNGGTNTAPTGDTRIRTPSLTRRHMLGVTGGTMTAALMGSIGTGTARAGTAGAGWVQPETDEEATQSTEKTTLITGANIFDGKSETLIEGMDVVIVGNKIQTIGRFVRQPDADVVIDADGRTLMPGLIDAHWHALLATVPQAKLVQSDAGYMNIVAAQANEDALLRGFTTVRDTGGNVFSLKQATDEGLVHGPRIFPSGPMISQTGGHADFRGPLDVPEDPAEPLDYYQRTGLMLIADGVPAVLKRSREAFRMGASQLKVMAGGGVASWYDPIDVVQYTSDEMKAAVQVADSYNSYVTVHAFNDKAVQHAIDAGVKCIEHGHLLEESLVATMAEKDVWLSMQPILDDEDAIPFPDPNSRKKFVEVTKGTDTVYKLAKSTGVKTAFGTDTLFDPELATKQGKQLAKLTRWYSPFETLKMATHDNAQLLSLSGPRNPYPGTLGVVEEGAFADLLLVDGNPLADIQLVANPEEKFVLIMKDGSIFKNTLD
ncbi:amidohydrolase family protein [Haloarchaeobius sp. HME9146]|uniref:metal-dependent hydrolase family protein n=1 Tax=Haloarchaeobius sp. HME9146 TaxID=2978732 RepID=UPI0021C1CFD2|nr:amidohydrolase family protein [Haloarchaeobius sp. HME9146]MCT9098429.1 amidohydrolase family protein [Haloarchaeobius sp. HME9146]